MSDSWLVVASVDKRSRMVPIGSAGDRLPSAFTAKSTYRDTDALAIVKATYNGERVNITSVTVKPLEGDTVTPAALARLQPAAVIQWACHDLVTGPRGEHNALALRGRPPGIPFDESEYLRRIAALYGFAHVSWGDPRRVVMDTFEMPRTTANRWIRRAAEVHTIPGRKPRKD